MKTRSAGNAHIIKPAYAGESDPKLVLPSPLGVPTDTRMSDVSSEASFEDETQEPHREPDEDRRVRM